MKYHHILVCGMRLCDNLDRSYTEFFLEFDCIALDITVNFHLSQDIWLPSSLSLLGMANRGWTRNLILLCKVEDGEDNTEDKGSWKEVECRVEKMEGRG